MVRWLALDAAFGTPVAGVFEGGSVVAEGSSADLKGFSALVAGLPTGSVDAVAVTVGPGSFTGLRAALALAHGFAAARGVPVVPVTVAEAFAAALPHPGRRALWTAIDSRRGRVFLDCGRGMVSTGLTDLPIPDRPVAVAGDAAPAVAASVAARGADVMLTDLRRLRARDVARAAAHRLDGGLAPLAPVPLYVDVPAARVPMGGLRPAPV